MPAAGLRRRSQAWRIGAFATAPVDHKQPVVPGWEGLQRPAVAGAGRLGAATVPSHPDERAAASVRAPNGPKRAMGRALSSREPRPLVESRAECGTGQQAIASSSHRTFPTVAPRGRGAAGLDRARRRASRCRPRRSAARWRRRGDARRAHREARPVARSASSSSMALGLGAGTRHWEPGTDRSYLRSRLAMTDTSSSRLGWFSSPRVSRKAVAANGTMDSYSSRIRNSTGTGA